MKQNKIAILSLSGGLDSTCLLMRLLSEGYKKIFCVSFNYGQKHSIELEKAKSNIDYIYRMGKGGFAEECILHHQIVDLSSLMSTFNSSLTSKELEVPEGHYEQENMKSTVVPNRNAIFSSMIFGLALSKSKEFDCDVDICLGIHAGDHAIYPDCTPQFRDSIEKAFKIGNWDSERVNYYTPYIDGNKTTILKDALITCYSLGLDFDIVLGNTITSYNPDSQGRSSGKSGSDIERIEAFINIDRKDPIEYQQPWPIIKKQTLQILKQNAEKQTHLN